MSDPKIYIIQFSRFYGNWPTQTLCKTLVQVIIEAEVIEFDERHPIIRTKRDSERVPGQLYKIGAYAIY